MNTGFTSENIPFINLQHELRPAIQVWMYKKHFEEITVKGGITL